MKKAILLISIITLFFAGCKKDDIAEASKVRIETETIEKGWDYIKINVEYDYPVALEAVSLYLSEKEDMSDANVYECNVEGKKYSVDVDSLKAGVAYYYCYEYDNGYEKVRCDVGGLMIITTKEVTNIKATTATCGGNVTSDGNSTVTARGVCWSTSPNPTINDNKTTDGSGTGSYTSNLTNLSDNTTYYVRAYATNEKGTSYGEEKSFATLKKVLPTVTTNAVTNIKATTATCGGYVSSDGNSTVTSRGICWSTSQNPTINDNKTTDGSGTGSYTSNISNLTPNTTYYVRAYATNEKGTSYGEEKSFTTLEFKNETISVNGVSFTMIAVEGGTFQMGATSEQGSDADSDESPVHSVTLSDYYIGETEVTQELWQAVMGSNPSHFSGYPQRPVECVSWNDCQEFIKKLNNLTGKNFRFPTEAEWEYAARGGNKSQGYKYSGNVAWYDGNSGSKTHDVKTKQANELGIYDMSGNVWEWCQDWYKSDYYSNSPSNNPTGPSSGSNRVCRGGSWCNYAEFCRVSLRRYGNPDAASYALGLRLSLSLY